MSEDDHDELLDLAGAVLDGEAVDWATASAKAAPIAQPLVSRLRLLATVADACRAEVLGTWGPLRLLEPIGRGAFGDVYRAWDPRLDRHVALKILPAPPPAPHEQTPSIIEEGRLLARVRHPNVVTIHGAEQIGDRVGLWMEYVDGRTLHDLVTTDGRRFWAGEVIAIGRSLCAAVGAVHEAGLLHRDVSARNVMMAGDGRVVLMDFGSGRDRATTRVGLTGTPLYVAPEVLSGMSPPTVRSDVYGVGVLLYFLLTGRYPVTGANVDELRERHTRGDRPTWSGLPRRVPAALRRAIERAIALRPESRPESATALATALDAAARPPLTGRTRLAVAACGTEELLAGAAWLTLSSGWRRPAAPTDASSDAQARRDVFRQAWALAEREGVVGPRQAEARFASMIAADPGYAPAHAGLALSHAYLSMNPYQGLTFAQSHATMRAAALDALRLDPGLAEAHVARGWVHAREFEWSDAEREFRDAIRLDPTLIAAYTSLVYSTLQPLGRLSDAEQLLRDAARIAPDHDRVPLALGRLLLLANRPVEAVAVLEPARRTDTDLLFVDLFLGRALLRAGRAAEALPLLERRRQRLVDPGAAPEPWVAWAYVALDRRPDAEALAVAYDHLPFRRVVINAALGRHDRMFHGLAEMAERESQRLPNLLREPELAQHRTDPRFRRLVTGLRLDDAQW